jgi:hypothetical protein
MKVRDGLIVGLTFAAMLFMGPMAGAHHGPSSFDTTKPITLSGVVKNVEWVNPHALLYLEVKDDSGKMETWVVQTAAPNILVRQGLPIVALRPGVPVVVTGYAPKADTKLSGMTSAADLIRAGRMLYSYEVKLANPR